LHLRPPQLPSFDLNEEEIQGVGYDHQADIAEIRKTFVIRDDVAITSFLHDHRAVHQLLLQAVPHLKRCFGAYTFFLFRALIDESGSRDLYAVAMWPGKARDAIEALDRFDTERWVANSRPAAGNLNFTYELE
jgi:hypothetical protein